MYNLTCTIRKIFHAYKTPNAKCPLMKREVQFDQFPANVPVQDRICAQSLICIPEASSLDTNTVRYHVYFQRNIRVQIKK